MGEVLDSADRIGREQCFRIFFLFPQYEYARHRLLVPIHIIRSIGSLSNSALGHQLVMAPNHHQTFPDTYEYEY